MKKPLALAVITLKTRELTNEETVQASGGADLSLVMLGGVRPGPRPGGSDAITASYASFTMNRYTF